MSRSQPRILFAGGGTGGHLYPALAIANEVKKLARGAEVLFVGTKDKIEARIVPQSGYRFAAIWIGGFHRTWRLENLLVPVKVIVSLIQSAMLVRQFRPDVAIGTGGYACGPVLYAASMLGVPTAVHESNSYPGLTTMLLARRATVMYTAFDETASWLKRRDNIRLVGTPTRAQLDLGKKKEAMKFFHLNPRKRTVLIFGGSLGARSINAAAGILVESLKRLNAQLLWQTGPAEYERLKLRFTGRNVGWMGPYIDRMDLAYAAADLAVSRSGATTIAEITRLGKPAVLVPYPHAAADHQTFNARYLQARGAAVLVTDGDVSARLTDIVARLLNDPRARSRMARASRSLGKPDAAKVVAKSLLALAGFAPARGGT